MSPSNTPTIFVTSDDTLLPQRTALRQNIHVAVDRILDLMWSGCVFACHHGQKAGKMMKHKLDECRNKQKGQ